MSPSAINFLFRSRTTKMLDPEVRQESIRSDESRRRDIINAATNPKARKRRLTLPFADHKALKWQRTSTQDKCTLLSLPYEIRENIWRNVLQEAGPAWVFLCSKKGHRLDHGVISEDRIYPEMRERQISGALSLLKTCRRIYSECIPILYSTNNFYFTELASFLAFKASIPSHHLAMIRHLEINMEFPFLLLPGDETLKSKQTHVMEWNATFESIAAIPNLRSLHISLVTRCYRDMMPHWPLVPGKNSSTILWSPMEKLQNIKNFKVAVSWPLAEYELPDQIPFTISSTHEDELAGADGESEDK